ncbi:MotA/TolQ/ExbB proton channel family protein [Methylobacterium sp. UNC300MFChir4.1]|uniref:MotA/TolQ/ExbB proton channel family protein n=1 Tax=Methylobacterium sp. UNC300MFChir4.1 TaxID=1502747 RepID=UPI0008D8D079|nr:MotA/TolQ/ExbB proton channel family protein [Methylobacterium sp. UNC300MFChir4.1]SEM86215.1 MotA/TolQ/ExbB proton channel family protein [Methylobacterium sp. UNC300MFChir4.1]
MAARETGDDKNGPLAQPGIYLGRMVIFLILVGFLAFILFRQITPAFLANPGLNGLILGVLLIAVLIAFGQVVRLFRETTYVNAVAGGAQVKKPPALLAPMAPMIAARAGGATLPGTTGYLDTIAVRLDEGREILRYISGILILLGLLGTFWGLIDTLSAVGGVIKGMRGGGDAGVMFDELKSGLAVPLSGIGLAFSASLFGLASSLITGFLELQAGQAHARFHNELQDWLMSGAAAPEAAPVAAAATAARPAAGTQELKEAVDRLSALVAEGGGSRAATQAMTNLAEGIQGLVQHMRAEQQMIRDWVEAQASRERELKQVLDRLGRERV